MSRPGGSDRVVWLACSVVALAWAAGVSSYLHGGYRSMWVTGLLLAGVALLLWLGCLMACSHLRRQAEKERRLRLAVEEAYRGTMHALTAALDLRDDETYGHSRRVMQYSLAMGRRLGLSPDDLQTLAWGALLHDLGKIGIRDGVLFKPGSLTPAERAEMNRHVIIGQELVAKVPFLARTHAMIRHHHERYDGAGYPDGLQGEAIPLLARLFTVADAYDAMTSSRPYRLEPLSPDQAMEVLQNGAGSQFCPRAVALFSELPRAELEPIRTNHFQSDDFAQELRFSID